MLKLILDLGEFVGVLWVELSCEFRVAAGLSQRLLKVWLKLSNLRSVSVSDQLLKRDSFLLGLFNSDES